jgi:hypothetical protein
MRLPRDGQAAPRVDQVTDFVGAGKRVGLVLGVHQLVIDLDVEDALVALLDFGVDAVALLELGRQTGGRREVVSLGAVGDPDLHGGLL